MPGCDLVVVTDEPAGDAAVIVPRKVTPLRVSKAQSTKTFYLSLSSQEKVAFIKQLPPEERKLLWSSLASSEKTKNMTHFVVASVNARPSWLPASYAWVV